MTTGNLLGPDEFLTRVDHFPRSGNDDPERDPQRTQGIEEASSGKRYEQARQDRPQRDQHVADVVNISQSNRRVVATRSPQQPGHAPISGGRSETDDNGDDA